jgi:hypothetical protein
MNEADFAERLRRMEDREQIRTLASLYSLAVDDHDFATLQSLFTADAKYGWVGSEARTVGDQAIVASFAEKLANSGPSFHVNHDQIVEWDEKDANRARGVVLCHAETSHRGGQNVAAIRYRDVYVRDGGRWKFGERLLAFLYFTPVDRYPDILMVKNRLRLPGGEMPAHWPAYA